MSACPPWRIALAGSAGTGKSTLAREIARRHALPYVPEGMRERLERGLELHALRPADLEAVVLEVWEEKLERERRAVAEAGGFVADRSPMDFLAFWLLYRCGSTVETERFYAETRAHLAALDRVVVLPWGVLPLEADGIRSADPWRQRHFQALVEGLLHRYGARHRVAWLGATTSLDERVREATAGLPGAGRSSAS